MRGESVLMVSSLSWLEIAIFVCFAAMGGALGHTMREVGKGSRPTFGRVILEALAAGFLGIIMLLLCKALAADWIWSGVIVGVFSWLGVDKTTAAILKAVKYKIRVSLQEDERRNRNE